MNLHKSFIVLGLIIAFALFCGIVALAQETSTGPTASITAQTEQQQCSVRAAVDRAIERSYLP